MGEYIGFGEMAWETPAAFVRSKRVSEGGRTMRVVEFQRGFVEEEWCAREHAGYVLEGRMTVESAGGERVEFGAGDGIDIPEGPEHGHKATPLSDRVVMVLFEPG
jgi:quercetin dioxygenase-like cupin family protein